MKFGIEPRPRGVRARYISRAGLVASIAGAVACMATHLVTLLGVAGATAWLGGLEPFLAVFTLGAVAITCGAFWHHRRHGCGSAVRQ